MDDIAWGKRKLSIQMDLGLEIYDLYPIDLAATPLWKQNF
jgi:hypothetical protein